MSESTNPANESPVNQKERILKACILGMCELDQREKEENEKEHWMWLEDALTLPLGSLDSFLAEFEQKVDDEDYSLFIAARVLLRSANNRINEVVKEINSRIGRIKVYTPNKHVRTPAVYEPIQDIRIEPAKNPEVQETGKGEVQHEKQ